jgi:hypothetical protein
MQTKFSASASASAKVGFAGASFETEVRSSYSQSRLSSDSYAFVRTTVRITKDAYFAENRTSADKYYAYLSEDFKGDLQNKTPEQIIDVYGTHVMMGAIWGARLDYNYSFKKTVDGLTRDVSAGISTKVEASIAGVTAGGGTSSDISYGTSDYVESGSMEKYTIGVGGAAEFAMGVHTGEDYTKWIDSIDAHQVWSDYYPDSLIPIYEFVQDIDKRTALETAYRSYLDGKQIVVANAITRGTASVNFTSADPKPVKAKNWNPDTTDKDGACWGGSDGEMNMEDRKSIHYQVKITLQKARNGNNGEAIIYYYQREGSLVSSSGVEGKLNDSYAKYRKTFTIPINNDRLIGLDASPMSWDSGECIYVHDTSKHAYNEPFTAEFLKTGGRLGSKPMPPLPDWLSNVRFVFDWKGGNDDQHIYVAGTITVPYTYLSASY